MTTDPQLRTDRITRWLLIAIPVVLVVVLGRKWLGIELFPGT